MPNPTMKRDRPSHGFAPATACVLALLLGAASVAPANAAVLSEDFSAVAAVPTVPSGPGSNCPQDSAFLARGWRVINNSLAAGATSPPTYCVTQGFPDGYIPEASFSAQDGSALGFAGMSTRATPNPSSLPVSLWMISPRIQFGTGATLEFWTRRVPANAVFGRERLQVRLMTAPGDPDVGFDANSLGQFTQLLLDINPTGSVGSAPCANTLVDPQLLSAYPSTWCQIRLTATSGLPTQGSGYIAFRYWTPAVPTPPLPSVIGIDTLSFDPGVVPTVAPTLSFGVPVGSTVTATGAGVIGATGALRIPVAIADPGSGGGPDALTTLQCVAATAPFSGFAQPIVAQPPGLIDGDALVGTCVRGASDRTQQLACTVTRGSAPPTSIGFVLSCPGGVTSAAYNRYADAVRADDPLIYWRLGEAGGDAINHATGPSSIGTTGDGFMNDTIERNQPALPQNGVPADGSIALHGGSSERVGSSGFFELLPPGANGITLETWLRYNALFDYVNLLGDRRGTLPESFVFLYLTPAQQLRLHVLTSNGLNAIDTSGSALLPQATYHVVATWDAGSGQMRIFVNGVESPAVAGTGSNPTTGTATLATFNPMYLGADETEADVGASIDFDEAAVYSKVLSPARIQAHYDLGSMLGDGFEG